MFTGLITAGSAAVWASALPLVSAGIRGRATASAAAMPRSFRFIGLFLVAITNERSVLPVQFAPRKRLLLSECDWNGLCTESCWTKKERNDTLSGYQQAVMHC